MLRGFFLPVVSLLGFSLVLGCSTAQRWEMRKRAQVQYRKGVDALRSRDVAPATLAFNACLSIDPGFDKCRYELGWAKFTDLDFKGAVEIWEGLMKTDPKISGLADSLQKAKAYLEIANAGQKLRENAPSTRRVSRAFVKMSARLRAKLIRLRAVGDVMIGTDFPSPNMLPPETGPKPLEQVRHLFDDTDIVFGNLEGALCDHGTSDKCVDAKGPCYAFRMPTRLGTYLKDAGFNFFSLANNHNADFGDECRMETEQTLDRLGIHWSGRPGTYATLDIRGTKVAIVAFHSAPHCNFLCDYDSAGKLVQSLRRKFPIVIVSFHGGAEGFGALHVPKKEEIFYGENRGDVEAFAHRMVESGASVVIGHGPHVPRAMEFYKGRLIAYSLGNFATYKAFNLSGFNSTSPMLEIFMNRRGRLITARIIPIHLLGEGIPMEDPTGASIDLIRYLSQQDFPATAPVIAQDGSIVPPWDHRTKRRRHHVISD